jgi:hypothetical protein
MDILLPFSTFGELAAFDLEVEVHCPRCGRRAPIERVRDRCIMGQRFACETVRWHGMRCVGRGIPYIRKRGRVGLTIETHSKLMRSRHDRPSDGQTTL